LIIDSLAIMGGFVQRISHEEHEGTKNTKEERGVFNKNIVFSVTFIDKKR